MVVNTLHLVTHSFPNSSLSCVFNFSLYGIPPTSIYKGQVSFCLEHTFLPQPHAFLHL